MGRGAGPGGMDLLTWVRSPRVAEVRKFVKFGLVGVVNTVIDLGLFVLLQRVLHVPYLIANIFAFAAAATNSYVLNRRWTFRSTAPDWHREITQFFAVTLSAFLANEGLLYLLVAHVHLPPVVAKLLAVVTVAWNFLANRLWTFRRR